MPFRQPADRTILNPPKSRNVCSPCFTFPLPASPRCGAPLAPHTAFSELFSEAFSEALSEALPKRFLNESKDGHLPSEPSKKGCRRTIGSNPKVTANCFNLKLYVPWTLQLAFWAQCWYFGRSNAKYASKRQRRGGSSKSSNSHRMLPLGFLRVNGQTCAQNRWLEHPEYQFPRLFTCKWCSTGQARAARVRTLYSKLQAGVPRVQTLCKTANPDAYFDKVSTRVRTFGVPRPKTANPDA